ncbi:hypothetical protein ACS0TY_021647 [Phlomoides rotata]
MSTSSIMQDSDQEDDSNPLENNYGEEFDNNVVEDDLDDDEVPINGDVTPKIAVVNETTLVEPGMIFSSIERLFEAYQEHTRLKGFGVVKRTTNERYARMVCDRSGTSKAQKCSKKVDCKARLNAKKLDDGTCMVTTMVSEHTHEIDPTFSQLMPAHRQLLVNWKRQLEANDIAGLRSCKNVRLCEVQCGGT